MDTIFGVDTETSGIPEWKKPSDDPAQPHIVSVAGIVVELATQKIIQSIDLIVRPNGWEISQDTVDVHGITTEHAMDVGVDEGLAATIVFDLARNRTRVAYNTTFDNRMVRIALKRFVDIDAADQWKAGDYECAMQLARKVMGGKQPKLVEAYKHFTGRELEGAHNAMADTLAAMDVWYAARGNEVVTNAAAPKPAIGAGDGQVGQKAGDIEF